MRRIRRHGAIIPRRHDPALVRRPELETALQAEEVLEVLVVLMGEDAEIAGSGGGGREEGEFAIGGGACYREAVDLLADCYGFGGGEAFDGVGLGGGGWCLEEEWAQG